MQPFPSPFSSLLPPSLPPYLHWFRCVIVKLPPLHRDGGQGRLEGLLQLTSDLSLPARLGLRVEELPTPSAHPGHGAEEVAVGIGAGGGGEGEG